MKRTTYQQSIMDATYAGVAMEAIRNGWDGAWERLIAQRLKQDCKKEHSEALEIVGSCDQSPNINDHFMKAAYLITSSTIQEHETTT